MMKAIGRRQFSIAAALAMLGGASITIGCGGGTRNPINPNAPALGAGDVAGSVLGNHPAPHAVVITAAQIAAGHAVTLELFGGFHLHTLALTEGDVAQIARRERLQKSSSVDTHSNGTEPHSHTVTFN